MTYLFEFDLSAAMTAGMSTVIFTLLFIDFFDTAGTLTSVANVAGKVSKDGKVQDINKAMLSDSVSTVAGAMNIQPSNLIKEDALFKAGEEDCIILICKNGTVSSKASGELKKQGYINVNVLSGGMMNWIQSGMPLVKEK